MIGLKPNYKDNRYGMRMALRNRRRAWRKWLRKEVREGRIGAGRRPIMGVCR